MELKFPAKINIIENNDDEERCCANCALRDECGSYTDDDGVCEEHLYEEELEENAAQTDSEAA